MATRKETVDYLVDQLSDAGVISAKRMFGEYGLYCDGVPVALLCDDDLFIKATAFGIKYAPDATLAPPYPGAKPSLRISPEHWDDRSWLAELIAQTRAGLALPCRTEAKSISSPDRCSYGGWSPSAPQLSEPVASRKQRRAPSPWRLAPYPDA